MTLSSTVRKTRLEGLRQSYRSAFHVWNSAEKAAQVHPATKECVRLGGEEAQELADEAARVYSAARNALSDEMLR